ncbi:hypothetical protein LTS16_007276 [Friedmanniomyces endolithicus]|nr:hypothetical protein LTS16_007276 [Friedmanniomyces endolithicus]
MALDPYEIGYFITQVGLSAASFGVAQSDITDVTSALFSLFSYKCEPPVTVVPAQGPVLDSICVDVTCPAAPNAMCGLYDNMNVVQQMMVEFSNLILHCFTQGTESTDS